MKKANLKRKPGHAICAVIEPKPDPTRQWREVPGVIMEAESQDNYDSWYGIFTEIGRETVEIQRRERRQKVHRHHGNQD